MSDDKDRLPAVDDTIKSSSGRTYTLISLLGEGGYGSVFETVCDKSDRRLALKAEKYSKTVLRIEIGVLKIANMRKCKHICQIVDHGQVKPEFMFVVMTLLGPDLNKLRNEQIGRHFMLGTAIRVAIQTLNCIEELHRCGFLSRDVKPGNFAIGSKKHNRRTIFIFDFGMAKKYVDKNLNVLPSRGEMGWRGTTRYGSLRAHIKQDLGRRDDLESWLYLIVEVSKGFVPWRLVTDRSVVMKAKQEARTINKENFLMGCPTPYGEIMKIIDKLEFETTPPYADIYKILNEIKKENNILDSMKYDWDGNEEGSSVIRSKTLSLDISPQKYLEAGNAEKDRPTRTDLPI